MFHKGFREVAKKNLVVNLGTQMKIIKEKFNFSQKSDKKWLTVKKVTKLTNLHALKTMIKIYGRMSFLHMSSVVHLSSSGTICHW